MGLITFLFFYLIVCAAVGWIAENRTIGFLKAFIISFLTTPIIGWIVAIMHPLKPTPAQIMQQHLQKQKEAKIQEMLLKNNSVSVADELSKLQKMKDEGHITEEEFIKAKARILT